MLIKRYIAPLFAVVLSIGLMGCGAKKEKETDIAGTEVTIKSLTITIPEGFNSSTTSGLYLCENYPDDQSNIYIYTTERSDNFAEELAGNSQAFADSLSSAYEEQYGEAPAIEVVAYESTDICGYDTYRVILSYELQSVSYYQTEYVINADYTYYVAYSQIGGTDYQDLFNTSATTITISVK